MAGQYTAKEKTIGELLSFTSSRLEVPPWQRSYSWRTQEVAAFWEDLNRFSERYPGDNIEGKEYFLGSVVLVDRTNHLEVLDGQQRLATATILLSALRDVAGDYNKDAATSIASDYIAKKDLATDTITYKLRLNEYDSLFFNREVQIARADGDPELEANKASHKLIRKARTHLLVAVRKRFEDLGGGKAGFESITRMLRVLAHHTSVVAVTSFDEDNAASVFETLNDRGISLSTPDLLRNYLLLRAVGDDERKQIVEYWDEILGIAGDNISVDEFLRHYWVAHHGDIKSRALYREIKGELETSNRKSLDFSEELYIASLNYRELVNASVKKRELRLLLTAVQDLNAKVLLPALLSAREGGTEDEQADLAAALVTGYVRHTLIAGLAGSDYESLVFRLAQDLRNGADFDSAIVQLREFAPSDEEFRDAFRKAEVPRSKSARYLIAQIEHHLRVTGEVKVEEPEVLHLEHIYPQTPQEDERLENHDEVVARLGNQTLLARRLNTSQRNAPFATKKAEAYEGSEILITKNLLEYDEWTEDTIDQQQAWLAEQAMDIWSFE